MGKKHASQYANFGWLRFLLGKVETIKGRLFNSDEIMQLYCIMIYFKMFPDSYFVVVYIEYQIKYNSGLIRFGLLSTLT